MSKVHNQTLLDEMVRQLALPRSQVKRAAEELLALVKEGLRRDGEVYISNFGTFRLKPVSERKGINPQTREAITIPAHYRVIFSPCKVLREAIKTSEQPVPPIPQGAVSSEAPPPPSRLKLSEAHHGETDTAPPEAKTIAPPQDQDVPHPPTSVSLSEIAQTPPSSSTEIDTKTSEQDSDIAPTRETDTTVPASQEYQRPETVQETLRHDIQDSLSPDTVENTSPTSPHKSRLGKGHIALALAVLVCSLVVVEFGLNEKDATDHSDGVETVSEPSLSNVTSTLASASEPDIAPHRQAAPSPEDKQTGSLPGKRADVATSERNASPPEINRHASKEDAKTHLSRSYSSQPARSPHFFEEQRHEVIEGESLWRLASRYYSNPLLWPHIFQANASVVSNPDKLVVGQSIIIPTLEGGPTKLTARDRNNIAEGYYLTYLFYEKSGRKDAFFALLEAKRYDSKIIEKHRRTLHLSRAEQVLLDLQTSISF